MRIVTISVLIYINVVLLLVLAPLQFGAPDLGLPYLGSGVRADLLHVVWID